MPSSSGGFSNGNHVQPPLIVRGLAAVGKQRQCVTGDHQFLVGRRHVNCNAAVVPRDQRCMRRIRLWIERHSQPAKLVRDAGAHRYRVLANTRREHERVEAAQRGRQHAGMEPDAVGEVFERKRSPRIGALLEVANVVADPG